jgi:hypothetical protein
MSGKFGLKLSNARKFSAQFLPSDQNTAAGTSAIRLISAAATG